MYPGEPKPNHFKGLTGLWSFFMLLVAALASYPRIVIAPASADSAMFLWMGRRMLAGQLPYRDMWDNKLPPIYWINCLAAAAGGANHLQLALWVLLAVAMAAGGWLIFAIGRRMFSAPACGLAGLTYVTLAASPAIGETGNLTEVWAAPFAILSIWAMVRLAESRLRGFNVAHPPSGVVRPGCPPPGPISSAEGGGITAEGGCATWAMLSGFGLATAACFRPPAILLIPVLLTLLPAVRRAGRLKWQTAGLWLIGLAITPLLILVWAMASGVLGQMWQDCVVFNLGYGTNAPRPDWATWQHVRDELIGLVFATWLWHLVAIIGLLIVVLGPPTEQPAKRFPTDSSDYADWVDKNKSVKSEESVGNPRRAGWFRLTVVVWLGCALASALPSLRLWPHHYYLTIAPLAMLSLWAWQVLIDRARSCGLPTGLPWLRPSWRLAGVGLVLLTAALLVAMHFHTVLKSARFQRANRAYIAEAARYLRANGGPTTLDSSHDGSRDQTMFLFGWGAESGLYAQLGWRCPTRHPMVLFYPEVPPKGPEMIRQWQDELVRHPPDWLVCTLKWSLKHPTSRPDEFEPMRRFWRAHYVLDNEFYSPDEEEGLLIYRRRD